MRSVKMTTSAREPSFSNHRSRAVAARMCCGCSGAMSLRRCSAKHSSGDIKICSKNDGASKPVVTNASAARARSPGKNSRTTRAMAESIARKQSSKSSGNWLPQWFLSVTRPSSMSVPSLVRTPRGPEAKCCDVRSRLSTCRGSSWYPFTPSASANEMAILPNAMGVKSNARPLLPNASPMAFRSAGCGQPQWLKAQVVSDSAVGENACICRAATSPNAANISGCVSFDVAYAHVKLASACTENCGASRAATGPMAWWSTGCGMRRFANAQIVFETFWGLKWSLVDIAASANAKKRGGASTPSLAKAQSVLEISCGLNWPALGIAASAMAANRFGSSWKDVAKAQAMLDNSCGLNCVILTVAARPIVARAAISPRTSTPLGGLPGSNLARPCAALASCRAPVQSGLSQSFIRNNFRMSRNSCEDRTWCVRCELRWTQRPRRVSAVAMLMPFIAPCSFQIRKTSPMFWQRAYIWLSSTSNFGETLVPSARVTQPRASPGGGGRP
mmetsp:Transcript_28557/g.88543  ORF Transcript_28557/g.88543 Transcript_28557/m.88543 type:complete len:503 (+) Transcript_28557:788-2296(+)